jgi:hypothetical protein
MKITFCRRKFLPKVHRKRLSNYLSGKLFPNADSSSIEYLEIWFMKRPILRFIFLQGNSMLARNISYHFRSVMERLVSKPERSRSHNVTIEVRSSVIFDIVQTVKVRDSIRGVVSFQDSKLLYHHDSTLKYFGLIISD